MADAIISWNFHAFGHLELFFPVELTGQIIHPIFWFWPSGFPFFHFWPAICLH